MTIGEAGQCLVDNYFKFSWIWRILVSAAICMVMYYKIAKMKVEQKREEKRQSPSRTEYYGDYLGLTDKFK